MEAMHREQLLEEFFSPHFKDAAAGCVFAKHRITSPTASISCTVAYNTNLVNPTRAKQLRRSVAAALRGPRRHRSRATRTGSAPWQGDGARRRASHFSESSPARRPKYASGQHADGRALVASGEIPLAATIYNHNAEAAGW